MAVPISNVTRRQVYAPSGAGGAGPYAFTFEILANTDIAVYKDDVLLTLTTHYTVTINANGTGSVTITATGLALAPTSPTQYAIVGNRTISRTTDFTTGGDFFANTLNDELDQQTIFNQQNAEGLQRALAAPQTDPTSINMTLPRAALRANKALGFDADGNPVISDTLGTNRGNWAAGVLYYARDIVKDTTNNNIWQCLVQHTSSGSQPINTNADSAKWSLLVDAASATTSANNAASSASAASTSASNASTSASNASTSASNASTSASNASSSASAASTSASNAAASYDSFDDRYLGSKSSAPSVDNDGNSLLTGALYWDSALNQMRVWSGTAWVNINASASNTRTAITATAGQTVLTVATYTPGTNTMVVYVNGVKLNASEYTETNATTITVTTGLALNDEVEVFSYRVNEIGTLGASSVTIADTGNYYAGSNAEVALQEAASFTQAGTGAVTRSKNSKLQESVSVKDFGAVGDYNSATSSGTSDFVAFDNALAATQGPIQVPPGNFMNGGTGGAARAYTGDGVVYTGSGTTLNNKFQRIGNIGGNPTKNHFSIACIPRCTAGVFSLLDDATHTPMNVSSVTQPDAFTIRVNYIRTASKINSFVVGPDDALTPYGVVCGGDVGTAYANIITAAPFTAQISKSGGTPSLSLNALWTGGVAGGSISVSATDASICRISHTSSVVNDPPVVSLLEATLGLFPIISFYSESVIDVQMLGDAAGYVSYDGSSWAQALSDNLTAPTLTWTASNTLKVDHGVSGSTNRVPLLTGHGGTYIPHVVNIGSTFFEVAFYDYAGTKITTQNTSMTFWYRRFLHVPCTWPNGMDVVVQRGLIKVPSALYSGVAGNNFWVMGDMEV